VDREAGSSVTVVSPPGCRAGLEFVEKLLPTKLTSTDTTERNVGMPLVHPRPAPPFTGRPGYWPWLLVVLVVVAAAHRKKKPGRPIDFGEEQKRRYRGRNVVERCFNGLKQWRGIAMRTDRLARIYRAAICLSATLIWIRQTQSTRPRCSVHRGC
jgi:hypothetical protein